jgi:SAM-dependent methyltransferase
MAVRLYIDPVRRDLPGLDFSTPNVARMYDYLLGGLNNFAADRAAAERVLTHLPQQRASAIENRRFIDRAVRFLASPERGVTQFLDIGAGLPTRQSVHEVAKLVNPACRVAYVDYDPVVVSHGKAMLAERDCSVVVQEDLCDPETLLGNLEIRAHLDLSRPVGLILVNILHWIPDADGPQQVLAVLRDALAPGSYLVLTHMSEDLIGTSDRDAANRAARVFDTASAQLRFRSRPEIVKLFDGWQFVDPGLVPKHEWRPDSAAAAPIFDIAYGGVARRS